MGRKRLTDTQREMLKATQTDLENHINWYYDQVVQLRSSVKETLFKKKMKMINIDIEKLGICHLKHITMILNWPQETHKAERNRLWKIANIITRTQGTDASTVNSMLLDVTRKFYEKDWEKPSDAFLSKKEQRLSRKRMKREKATGKPTVKVVATDDQKKEARKERARIRKEAAKLGITTAEYKARQTA